jgi:hypothetical protein
VGWLNKAASLIGALCFFYVLFNVKLLDYGMLKKDK